MNDFLYLFGKSGRTWSIIRVHARARTYEKGSLGAERMEGKEKSNECVRACLLPCKVARWQALGEA